MQHFMKCNFFCLHTYQMVIIILVTQPPRLVPLWATRNLGGFFYAYSGGLNA
jgi:hypothetical protein